MSVVQVLRSSDELQDTPDPWRRAARVFTCASCFRSHIERCASRYLICERWVAETFASSVVLQVFDLCASGRRERHIERCASHRTRASGCWVSLVRRGFTGSRTRRRPTPPGSQGVVTCHEAGVSRSEASRRASASCRLPTLSDRARADWRAIAPPFSATLPVLYRDADAPWWRPFLAFVNASHGEPLLSVLPTQGLRVPGRPFALRHRSRFSRT